MDYSQDLSNLLRNLRNNSSQTPKSATPNNEEVKETEKELLSKEDKNINNGEIKSDDLYGGMAELNHNKENVQKQDNSEIKTPKENTPEDNQNQKNINEANKQAQNSQLNNLLKSLKSAKSNNSNLAQSKNNNPEITNETNSKNSSDKTPNSQTNKTEQSAKKQFQSQTQNNSLNNLLKKISNKTLDVYSAQAALAKNTPEDNKKNVSDANNSSEIIQQENPQQTDDNNKIIHNQNNNDNDDGNEVKDNNTQKTDPEIKDQKQKSDNKIQENPQTKESDEENKSTAPSAQESSQKIQDSKIEKQSDGNQNDNNQNHNENSQQKDQNNNHQQENNQDLKENSIEETPEETEPSDDEEINEVSSTDEIPTTAGSSEITENPLVNESLKNTDTTEMPVTDTTETQTTDNEQALAEELEENSDKEQSPAIIDSMSENEQTPDTKGVEEELTIEIATDTTENLVIENTPSSDETSDISNDVSDETPATINEVSEDDDFNIDDLPSVDDEGNVIDTPEVETTTVDLMPEDDQTPETSVKPKKTSRLMSSAQVKAPSADETPITNNEVSEENDFNLDDLPSVDDEGNVIDTPVVETSQEQTPSVGEPVPEPVPQPIIAEPVQPAKLSAVMDIPLGIRSADTINNLLSDSVGWEIDTSLYDVQTDIYGRISKLTQKKGEEEPITQVEVIYGHSNLSFVVKWGEDGDDFSAAVFDLTGKHLKGFVDYYNDGWYNKADYTFFKNDGQEISATGYYNSSDSFTISGPQWNLNIDSLDGTFPENFWLTTVNMLTDMSEDKCNINSQNFPLRGLNINKDSNMYIITKNNEICGFAYYADYGRIICDKDGKMIYQRIYDYYNEQTDDYEFNKELFYQNGKLAEGKFNYEIVGEVLYDSRYNEELYFHNGERLSGKYTVEKNADGTYTITENNESGKWFTNGKPKTGYDDNNVYYSDGIKLNGIYDYKLHKDGVIVPDGFWSFDEATNTVTENGDTLYKNGYAYTGLNDDDGLYYYTGILANGYLTHYYTNDGAYYEPKFYIDGRPLDGEYYCARTNDGKLSAILIPNNTDDGSLTGTIIKQDGTKITDVPLYESEGSLVVDTENSEIDTDFRFENYNLNFSNYSNYSDDYVKSYISDVKYYIYNAEENIYITPETSIREGYDKFGLDENGLQYDGYDLDGYDINGCDKFGNLKSETVQNPSTISTSSNLSISDFDGIAKFEALDLKPFDSTHLTRDDFEIQGQETIGDKVFEYGISKSDGQTYYFVDSADKLQAINSGTNKNYVLMCDIDLEGWDSGDGTGWKPIGNSSNKFKGTFDGNGYTVSNINCTNTTRYSGLFGKVHGTVKNTGVKNANISGAKRDSGALVGWLEGGSIDNCFAEDVTINATETAGGLVGYFGAYGVFMNNCYTKNATVSCPDAEGAGGLCGYNYSVGCTISDCYTVGAKSNGGAFIGYNDGRINNSAAFVNNLSDVENSFGNGSKDTYGASQDIRVDCKSYINSNTVMSGLNDEVKLDNLPQGNVDIDGKLYHNGVAYTGFINDRYFIDGEPANGGYYCFTDSFGNIIKMSKEDHIDSNGYNLSSSGFSEYKDGYLIKSDKSSFINYDSYSITNEKYDVYGNLISFTATNETFNSDFVYNIEYSGSGYSVTAKALDRTIDGSFKVNINPNEYGQKTIISTEIIYDGVKITKSYNDNPYTKVEAKDGTTITSYCDDVSFSGTFMYSQNLQKTFSNGVQVIINNDGKFKVTDKEGNITVFDANGQEYTGVFDNLLYENGKLYSGEVTKENISQFTDLSSSLLANIDTKMFKDGVLANDVIVSNTLYYNGEPATGYNFHKNKLYLASSLYTGGYRDNSLYKDVIYKDGELLNGEYIIEYDEIGTISTVRKPQADEEGKYYENGIIASDKLVNGILYYQGKVAQDFRIFDNQMYYNGEIFTGHSSYNDKVYVDGNAINGKYVIEYDENRRNITNIRKADDNEENENILLYEKGSLVDNKIIDGKLYLNGKVAEGISYLDDIAYYNGDIANGNILGYMYLGGAQLNGYYIVNNDDIKISNETNPESKLYKDGKLVDNEVLNNIYYENGRIAEGFDLVKNTMFHNGIIYTGETDEANIYIYGKPINGYYTITKDEDENIISIKHSDKQTGTYYEDGAVSTPSGEEPADDIIDQDITEDDEDAISKHANNVIVEGIEVDGEVICNQLYVNGVVGGTATVDGYYYENGNLSLKDSAVIDNIMYHYGRAMNGFASDGLYYKDGSLANDVINGVKFKDGDLFCGIENGTYYSYGFEVDEQYYYDTVPQNDDTTGSLSFGAGTEETSTTSSTTGASGSTDGINDNTGGAKGTGNTDGANGADCSTGGAGGVGGAGGASGAGGAGGASGAGGAGGVGGPDGVGGADGVGGPDGANETPRTELAEKILDSAAKYYIDNLNLVLNDINFRYDWYFDIHRSKAIIQTKDSNCNILDNDVFPIKYGLFGNLFDFKRRLTYGSDEEIEIKDNKIICHFYNKHEVDENYNVIGKDEYEKIEYTLNENNLISKVEIKRIKDGEFFTYEERNLNYNAKGEIVSISSIEKDPDNKKYENKFEAVVKDGIIQSATYTKNDCYSHYDNSGTSNVTLSVDSNMNITNYSKEETYELGNTKYVNKEKLDKKGQLVTTYTNTTQEDNYYNYYSTKDVYSVSTNAYVMISHEVPDYSNAGGFTMLSLQQLNNNFNNFYDTPMKTEYLPKEVLVSRTEISKSNQSSNDGANKTSTEKNTWEMDHYGYYVYNGNYKSTYSCDDYKKVYTVVEYSNGKNKASYNSVNTTSSKDYSSTSTLDHEYTLNNGTLTDKKTSSYKSSESSSSDSKTTTVSGSSLPYTWQPADPKSVETVDTNLLKKSISQDENSAMSVVVNAFFELCQMNQKSTQELMDSYGDFKWKMNWWYDLFGGSCSLEKITEKLSNASSDLLDLCKAQKDGDLDKFKQIYQRLTGVEFSVETTKEAPKAIQKATYMQAAIDNMTKLTEMLTKPVDSKYVYMPSIVGGSYVQVPGDTTYYSAAEKMLIKATFNPEEITQDDLDAIRELYLSLADAYGQDDKNTFDITFRQNLYNNKQIYTEFGDLSLVDKVQVYAQELYNISSPEAIEELKQDIKIEKNELKIFKEENKDLLKAFSFNTNVDEMLEQNAKIVGRSYEALKMTALITAGTLAGMATAGFGTAALAATTMAVTGAVTYDFEMTEALTDNIVSDIWTDRKNALYKAEIAALFTELGMAAGLAGRAAEAVIAQAGKNAITSKVIGELTELFVDTGISFTAASILGEDTSIDQEGFSSIVGQVIGYLIAGGSAIKFSKDGIELGCKKLYSINPEGKPMTNAQKEALLSKEITDSKIENLKTAETLTRKKLSIENRLEYCALSLEQQSIYNDLMQYMLNQNNLKGYRAILNDHYFAHNFVKTEYARDLLDLAKAGKINTETLLAFVKEHSYIATDGNRYTHDNQQYLEISNIKISEFLKSDIDLLKAGKTNDVKIMYLPETEYLLNDLYTKSKPGDVISNNGKMYINDGKKVVPWDMTIEMYEKLFPLVERSIYKQNNGTCHLGAPESSLMLDAELRTNIYKRFSVKGNDVICKLTDGTEVTFKNGELIPTTSERGHKIDDACMGLQMIEEALAISSLDLNYQPYVIPIDILYGGRPALNINKICDNYKAQTEYIYGPENLQKFVKEHKCLSITVGILCSDGSSHEVGLVGYDPLTKRIRIVNTQAATAFSAELEYSDSLRICATYIE